jgi:hypothetical protein
MAVLRSVAKTDTFEIQRQKINQIAQDLYTVQTAVGEGGFSLSNGSVSEPALFFTSQPSVGIYKGQGKSFNIASNNKGVISFSDNYVTSLQNIRTLISSIPPGNSGVTIANSGTNYNPGTYANVPLLGGSGGSALATVTVVGINGSITSQGIRYVGGSYTNVPLTGGSGTSATANITVAAFNGQINTPGSGGSSAGTFTNVLLTGGGGSGARATITTLSSPGPGGVGTVVNVSSVVITDTGTGTYAVGDILSANPSSIGGVTGFQYVLIGVGNITNLTITNSGSGYQANNVLSAANTNLGGSGSGFQFTISNVNYVSSVEIDDGGDGYATGDIVSISPYELYPTVIRYVEMRTSQLLIFSGTLPTSDFQVNSNLTYNGQSKRIVKRFLNGSNEITAVTVDSSSSSLTFANGLQASSNGTSVTVSSINSALNYYFSDSENPNNDNDWINIQNFTFKKNERYIFIQKDNSNNTHPLRFSSTPDGFHTPGGDVYNGDEVNYNYPFKDSLYAVSIIPNSTTPTTLYYFCGEGLLDPFNAHTNEGGFDNREGTITISGEISPTVGSGVQIVLANISEEQNVLIERSGNISVKEISATSGLLTGNLTIQQDLNVSGDFELGSNKATINSSTGDTYIDGDLSVNGELQFLNDASLGGTLYIDSTNNRVSINKDPDLFPITNSLEVEGTIFNNDNAFLATDSGSYLRIGSGLSGNEKLQVGGRISATQSIIGPSDSAISTPQFTFANNSRYGVYFNDVDKQTSIVGNSGEIVAFSSNTLKIYRNTEFSYSTITETTLTNGSGYTDGTYNGLVLSGGTGSGLAANIIVAFTVPLGFIESVTNISSADATKVAGTYTISEYTTSGSTGTDAIFEIEIDSSGDASITILNGGKEHVIGDTITISGNLFTSTNPLVTPQDITFDVDTLSSNPGAGYTDATYENVPLTGGSGSNALATVTISGGEVVEVIVTSAGSGYVSGNLLSFNHTSLNSFVNNQPITSVAPTTPASLKIDALGAVTSVTIVDFGEGYTTQDILSFPSAIGETPVDEAFLLIETVTNTNTVLIDKDLGSITANLIQTVGSGINIDSVLSIDNNIISSLNNSDIIITPGSSSRLLSISGSGGIKVPVGNSTNRPSASTLGIIRYNSQTQQYEGSNGSNFISLGGVRDVDGNTYIIAEEETGANDNILYFFNDADNSVRLNRNELELVTATTISSKDTDGKFKWKENTAYLLNALVYHDTNLYQVTTAGTTGTIAPTHSTGVEINGTAALTYVSSTYGDLTLKANNIIFDGQLTLGGSLQLYTLNNKLIFENTSDAFIFAFGDNSGTPNVFASITDFGSLLINKNYNTLNPENNLTILDYTGKFIDLDDVKIQTFDLTLTKGATETGSIQVYDPDLCKGAKVTIVAENVTSDDIHIVEYNIISKGSDIYVNEYGNLDTGLEQYQVEWVFSPGGNIQGNLTLSSALTASDVVIITASITQIKK